MPSPAQGVEDDEPQASKPFLDLPFWLPAPYLPVNETSMMELGLGGLSMAPFPALPDQIGSLLPLNGTGYHDETAQAAGPSGQQMHPLHLDTGAGAVQGAAAPHQLQPAPMGDSSFNWTWPNADLGSASTFRPFMPLAAAAAGHPPGAAAALQVLPAAGNRIAGSAAPNAWLSGPQRNFLPQSGAFTPFLASPSLPAARKRRRLSPTGGQDAQGQHHIPGLPTLQAVDNSAALAGQQQTPGRRLSGPKVPTPSSVAVRQAAVNGQGMDDAAATVPAMHGAAILPRRRSLFQGAAAELPGGATSADDQAQGLEIQNAAGAAAPAATRILRTSQPAAAPPAQSLHGSMMIDVSGPGRQRRRQQVSSAATAGGVQVCFYFGASRRQLARMACIFKIHALHAFTVNGSMWKT